MRRDYLQGAVASDSPLATSIKNVYGAYPAAGMNRWEREFGQFLDGDDSGTVLWWHRNLPRKPWSVNVLMESGSGFFPDFIVGIKDRKRADNAILSDTKYAWDTSAEFPKLLADHVTYGKVLILTKPPGQQGWHVVGVDASGRAHVERRFRLAEAARC
jgi:hypothetical protein